jgi:hypothetical protein
MAAVETLAPSLLPISPVMQGLPEGVPEELLVPNNKTQIPIKESLAPSDQVAFDASKHIQFFPPSKVWTMKELEYPDGSGISPVGVSEPFPLFTEDAIKQMRAEILSDNVWSKYQYSSNLSQCQLRGFAPEYVICSPPDR